MSAPRHAKAQYTPRHSRHSTTRRYARVVTPVTLVGVLALGSVGAVAVPVIHATADDSALARGERHYAPAGASGAEGIEDDRVLHGDDQGDDNGGEGDSEHTRPDVGPLPPLGSVPGTPGTGAVPWTPPGTDSPNTPSPTPSDPGSPTSDPAPSDAGSSSSASTDPTSPAPSGSDPTTPGPTASDSQPGTPSTSTDPSTPTPTDSTTPAPSDTPTVDPSTPAPVPSTSSSAPDPGAPAPSSSGPQPPSVPPTPTVDPNAMPIANLSGWTQVFADDFNRDAATGSFLSMYGNSWSAYPSPWRDTSGNGVYDPARTLSVANSMLDIHVHTENGTHLVAAPSPKLPAMTYGRYSVRFRADAVPGYKTAWLLWPDDNVWPLHGEVDFPEGNLDQHISAFSHYANALGGQDAFPTSATYTDWHIATVEWTPGQLVFILDGRVVGTSTTQVPSGPMHWVLQTETQLSGGAPADSAAGHVQVDWVTAYSYTP